ncbi:MAG: hypothetical protein ABIF87_05140 [Pseudomonadota bacterium]
MLDSIFLGQRWIQKRISEYSKERKAIASLRDRTVAFPAELYLAGLMHIYTGTLSLAEIAKAAGVPLKEFKHWRTQLDFMVLVDAAKVDFSDYFRENLLLNEFEPAEYRSIAAEYSLFDEQVRTQIRTPLFQKMKHLANSISNYNKVKLKIDRSDLRTFKKLYSFFMFEKNFLPTTYQETMRERLDLVAKDIVWSRLGVAYSDTEQLLGDNALKKNIKNFVMEQF